MKTSTRICIKIKANINREKVDISITFTETGSFNNVEAMNSIKTKKKAIIDAHQNAKLYVFLNFI